MPPSSSSRKYAFISKAPGLDPGTFVVRDFQGREAISQTYEFNLTLASDKDFDLDQVMKHRAEFIIHGLDDVDTHFHGIPATLEETHEQQGFIFYRAVLVPQFYLSNITEKIQVFIDVTLPDMFRTVLNNLGLGDGVDYEFRFQRDYPEMEFATQYRESNFNFLCRWMEQEGIYFFFEQTPDNEKIIFTDTSVAHSDIRPRSDYKYAPPSGLEPDLGEECIQVFKRRLNLVPGEIFIKDYNYARPSLTVEGRADISERKQLLKQVFGYHFENPDDGERLAKYQAEAVQCRESQYHAESTIPSLCPGFKFSLKDHYRDAWNKKYLILDVDHSGQQVGYFNSVLKIEEAQDREFSEYRNTFCAIESSTQYRMEKKTPRPLIHGVLHGKIDSEGEGEYAELDDKGRYKVRLPFDVDSSHGAGHASTYLRMQQPYGGLAEGMHFPLRKGTEVSIVCTGGDPDRMEICGVVPNPHCASPVTSANPTESVITSSSGNLISMDDKKGSEGLVLHTPHENTYVRLGAKDTGRVSFNAQKMKAASTSDSGSPDNSEWEDPDGLKIHTEGDLVSEIGSDMHTFVGGQALDQIGVKEQDLAYDFTSDKPEKGTYVAGDLEVVTKGKSSEQVGVSKPSEAHTFTSTNLGKGVYVNGDNELYVEDNCTIKAKGKKLKITLDDDGITIDAGQDSNVKLIGKNQQKITYGHKEGGVFGNSASFVIGGNESLSLGGKVGVTLVEELSLSAALKQAVNLAGVLNIDLATSQTFALGLVKAVMNLTPLNISLTPFLNINITGLGYSKTLIDLSEKDADVKQTSVKKDNDIISLSEEEVEEDGGGSDVPDLSGIPDISPGIKPPTDWTV